jgi:hypothetical protein
VEPLEVIAPVQDPIQTGASEVVVEDVRMSEASQQIDTSTLSVPPATTTS